MSDGYVFVWDYCVIGNWKFISEKKKKKKKKKKIMRIAEFSSLSPAHENLGGDSDRSCAIICVSSMIYLNQVKINECE